MKWTVDRLEGNYAVIELENKETADIPLKALPDGVKEGDILCVAVDKDKTAERKTEIDSLANRLFK